MPNSGDSLANTVARAATREWSRGCEKQAAADEAAASSIVAGMLIANMVMLMRRQAADL